ncbi:MAG: hypothetical protein AAF512_04270 [Pseudomonadota bacterium]
MRRTVLTFLALAASSGANAEWFYDAEAGLTYDDNVNRAEASRDIEEDTIFSLGLSAGRAFPLENAQTLVVMSHLKLARHTEISDLGSIRPGITLRYLNKLGLGPLAPRISLGGSIEYISSRDDLRDSWRYQASFGYSKRLSELWDINANASYSIRRMQDVPGGLPFATDVFDQNNFSLSLGTGYAVSENWLINFGYRFDKGDVDSVATAPNPPFVRASSARILDPSFGPSKVVYKLDADTHSFLIDASRALNEQTSVNIGYERIMTDAVDNIEYDSNIFRINLLYTF